MGGLEARGDAGCDATLDSKTVAFVGVCDPASCLGTEDVFALREGAEVVEGVRGERRVPDLVQVAGA